MKELNIMQLEDISGGALADCVAAAGWGLLAISVGVTGVGLGFGWFALGAGIGSLTNCVG